jgi:hypothetical protein
MQINQNLWVLAFFLGRGPGARPLAETGVTRADPV